MSELPRLLVLAGGRGSRLLGIVGDRPKPMALISGRPFLEIQLDYFKAQGITKCTLLVSHMAEKIIDYFGDGSKFGMHLEYLHEESPMGTGGAIRNAIIHYSTEDSFVVINGDTLFTLDVRDFIRVSRAPCFMALRATDDCSRYGQVRWQASDFSVTEFEEKKEGGADGFVNGGVYFLNRQFLKFFPHGRSSFETEVLPSAVREKCLYGVPCPGRFVDIGTPETLLWSQNRISNWCSEPRRPCLFLGRDGVLVRPFPLNSRVTQAEVYSEMVELVGLANEANWVVSVVSNQSGIEKGYLNSSDSKALNNCIADKIRADGARIDSWDLCPYDPHGTIGEVCRNSIYRKPSPGMILRTSEIFNIKLSGSIMIGNSLTDRISIPGLETWLINADPESNDGGLFAFENHAVLLQYAKMSGKFERKEIV